MLCCYHCSNLNCYANFSRQITYFQDITTFPDTDGITSTVEPLESGKARRRENIHFHTNEPLVWGNRGVPFLFPACPDSRGSTVYVANSLVSEVRI